MAEKTPAEQAQREREQEAAKAERQRERDAEETPSYEVGRLLAESQSFTGHPPHVLAGALALSGTRKKNLTVAEAKKAIDKYLEHEAEED